MNKPFILYGWHLSYFSGKARCYLQYKNIPFVDEAVNMPTLMLRIKHKTGAVVMPVLVTPEGRWIQDTSEIVDGMEARFPQSSVHPTTPVQRFASYLMEAWGDEWWVPIAMHTRWNYPENYPLFEQEAGDALLPRFPGFIKRRAVARVADTLRGMLPTVGIKPAQYTTMEQWTHDMLDVLDAHFAVSPFLFGDRPALGDFGLVGTMYGHLGRDPWPRRELVAPRPHLRAWIDRMATLKPHTQTRFLADDRIAPTLEPVFRRIFTEFIPMLEGINSEVRAKLPSLKPGRALPRALGEIEFPMGAQRFRRAALPYTLWMAQRTLDCYRAMPAVEQQQVRDWLIPLGGERLLALDIPRLRRVALRVAPV